MKRIKRVLFPVFVCCLSICTGSPVSLAENSTPLTGSGTEQNTSANPPQFSETDLIELLGENHLSQAAVLFDWDSPTPLYHLPALQNTQASPAALSEGTPSAAMQAESVVTESGTEVSAEFRFSYQNVFCEKQCKPNETLRVHLSGTVGGSAQTNAQLRLAQYNDTGKLLGVTGTPCTLSALGEEITLDVPLSSQTAKASVLLWDSVTQKPLCDAVTLTDVPQDTFSDIPGTALSYPLDREISGRIDSASDTDYIKFVPETSGGYFFSVQSSVNPTCTLYSAEQEEICASTSDMSGCYIKKQLCAGQTYYLKISGNQIGDYRISIRNTDQNAVLVVAHQKLTLILSDATGGAECRLFAQDGSLLQTVQATLSGGTLTAEFPLTETASAYRLVAVQNGRTIDCFRLTILEQTHTFSLSKKSYVSVPFILSGATSLENLCFSLSFDPSDFVLYDACEHTYNTRETGCGIVSDVTLRAVLPDTVVFSSSRIPTSDRQTLNTIKLKALRSGNGTIYTYGYRME